MPLFPYALDPLQERTIRSLVQSERPLTCDEGAVLLAELDHLRTVALAAEDIVRAFGTLNQAFHPVSDSAPFTEPKHV